MPAWIVGRQVSRRYWTVSGVNVCVTFTLSCLFAMQMHFGWSRACMRSANAIQCLSVEALWTFCTTGRCDDDSEKWYKYVCVTTNQPGTKPYPKQHAIVSIQLNNYSWMFYVSRDIHTSRCCCCCTVFTTFRCHCDPAAWPTVTVFHIFLTFDSVRLLTYLLAFFSNCQKRLYNKSGCQELRRSSYLLKQRKLVYLRIRQPPSPENAKLK